MLSENGEKCAVFRVEVVISARRDGGFCNAWDTLPATRYRLLATGYKLPATSYRLIIVL